MQRWVVAAASLAMIAALAGCGDDSGEASEGGLRVVASFYPLAEAAERVGGDLVAVTNLTPAGTEPHDLELTPDQVDELEDADVVLYVGQGFQPAVEEIVERRDGTSIDVLEGMALEEGAPDEHGHEEDEDQADEEGEDHADEEGEEGEDHADEEEGEHAESGLDPHFWLDPQRFVDAVGRIEEALADESPDDAADFAANANEYRAEIDTLDDEFADGLATCERHDVVTSHAAFHYLAERYGLTQRAISGVSPESEPDPDRLAELSDFIDANGVTTVFYETLVPADLAETLANEAGVTTAVLNPIEGLTDAQLDDGATYTSVMRENLGALKDALGCS
ncbi:MAG: metal ABC transporter substrate-binding protein [Acidimicrobiales bacterium]